MPTLSLPPTCSSCFSLVICCAERPGAGAGLGGARWLAACARDNQVERVLVITAHHLCMCTLADAKAIAGGSCRSAY